MHFHRFGKEQGISGVAVLAESHISVHTWPERNYVAFDIFMCGDTSPEIGAEHLIKTFNPKRKVVKIIKRGVKKLSNNCLRWLDKNKPESPSAVYDLSIIEKNYLSLKRLFRDIEIFYAVKANSHKKIIDYLNKLGSSFDCASIRKY